jgi:hypothetical protein
MRMTLNNLFIDLSWLNALGQQTQSAQAIDGKEQNSQKSGARLFNYWLNMRRYPLWRGLASPLNLTKKAGGFKM